MRLSLITNTTFSHSQMEVKAIEASGADTKTERDSRQVAAEAPVHWLDHCQETSSRSIRQAFSSEDITGTGQISVEESGPPSPQSGIPVNFGVVEEGIYRSSFPQNSNIAFLESLRLKTIVMLVPTEYTAELATYFERSGLQLYRINIPPHKSEDDRIPIERTAQVMRLLLDPANRPILVHCNKGKHRTGCMVASFRKIQAMSTTRWDLPSILAEYHQYAGTKARAYDEIYIKAFQPQDALDTIMTLEKSARPICYELPPVSLETSNKHSVTNDGDEAFSKKSKDKLSSELASPISPGGLDAMILTHALRQLEVCGRKARISREDLARDGLPTPPDTESDDSMHRSPLRRFS